jgi:phosphonate transport system permease protein
MAVTTAEQTQQPVAFPPNWPVRIATLAVLLYAAYTCTILDISQERFISGLSHAAKLFSRMFPPNTAHDKVQLITEGMIESIQIAILSTFFGTLLSLPLGFIAARNLVPLWLAMAARMVIAVCRSFHPIIISILFVKAVGFGALAGMMALVISSMGFIAKLFAEILEEISQKQIEAIRATGASFANIVIFAVIPQVMARFIGLSVYQFDSNLRNSTMVGIVGGGGIGAALFTAYQRFDYDVVLTILLIIIALIILCEIVSGRIRTVTQ